MKRTTLVILLLAMLVVSCFAFTACHEHEFGDWTVTKQPTCTQAGSKERVCECGKKQREVIDTIGPHGFQETGVCQYCQLDLNDILIKRYGMSATADDNVYGYVVSGPNGDYEAYIIGTGAMMDYTLNKAPFSTDGYDIKNVYISNGVTRIGKWVFQDCTSLANIIIPSSVTSIGTGVFLGCTSLTSITIPSSVTKIPDSMFYDCTSLKNITIPSSIKSIDNYAFFRCTNLTNVTIGEGVTSIGFRTFEGCTSLTSVTIPKSVTCIESQAFSDCSRLASITIEGSPEICGYNRDSNPFYGTGYYNNVNNWEDGILYIGTCLVAAKTTAQTIVIKEGITVIADYAFSNCTNLTNVTIPSSVISVGSNSFDSCPIERATIPAIACSSVANSKLKEVSIISGDSIAERAFLNCTNLTNVTIGNSVTSIGDYAFQNCTGIASIDIPSNVTEIGEAAFVYCTNLTNLTIAEGVKSMGTAAFYGCSSLVSVTIPSTMTSISDRSFRECTSLVSVDIPSSVTSIENCAFQQCTSLTSIDIPSSVTQIGESAFLMCTGLTSITIPSGVTSIGDRAFLGCTNLKSVTFADPYGWYCNKTQGATSGIDLTLTDATQNANYLVSEDYYRDYWWYKIANN